MKTVWRFNHAQMMTLAFVKSIIPIDRFWNKINITNGCWLWTAAVWDKNNYSNYGAFSWNGKMWKAHRFMMFQIHGQLPSHVLHTCDDPRCVNPNHLYFGTDRDNANDRRIRGRGGSRKICGALNINAVGDATDARKIVARYKSGNITQKQLATEFGLSKGTIWNVITGRHWATRS